MRFTRYKHRSYVQPVEETHVVVETDEHEHVEIDGCSPEEVDAKLKDFYAWAS